MMGLLGQKKKFDAIFRHLNTMHNVTDGQKDGRTPDDSKDRAYA